MFIYKTTHISGKYYIGRCSRKNSDSYLGSGRWVKSIKDKSTLTREILSRHSTFEELIEAEEKAISEHIDNPLCMNWSNSSTGFSTGDRNPSVLNNKRIGTKHNEHTKKLISEKKKELYKNGFVHPLTGKETSELQKKKTSEANSGKYEITLADGVKITITNFGKFCKENGFSAVTFQRYHSLGKPYKDMTYVRLA